MSFIFILALLGCQKKGKKIMILRKIAHEINKSCPQILDNDTRLEKVESIKDSVLIYNYTLVNVLRHEINVPKVKKELATNIRANFLKDPDFEVFRKMGVIMRYNYKDKGGVDLFSFDARQDE